MFVVPVDSDKIPMPPPPKPDWIPMEAGKRMVMVEPDQPMFQRLCTEFLSNECIGIVNMRGTDYGDTLKHCQWLYMKAVAKKLGYDLTTAQCRAIAMSSVADWKYQRMEGGYKDDHVVDGINYESTVPQLLEEALAEQKEMQQR